MVRLCKVTQCQGSCYYGHNSLKKKIVSFTTGHEADKLCICLPAFSKLLCRIHDLGYGVYVVVLFVKGMGLTNYMFVHLWNMQ